MVTPYHISVLVRVIDRRVKNNPLYSLRSFAKTVEISPSSLSQILNGRQAMSLKMCQKILPALQLKSGERKRFLESVISCQKKRRLKRTDPKIKEFRSRKRLDFIPIDEYSEFSKWYYNAILELTFRDDFKADSRWVARQLNISHSQATIAVKKLISSGQIIRENGRFIKNRGHTETSNRSVTNFELKAKQKEIRKMAISAIDTQSIKKRSMTSMTMCIDPDLLPKAKEMILKFNKEMTELLESKKRKNVYCLEIGLFSLQANTEN